MSVAGEVRSLLASRRAWALAEDREVVVAEVLGVLDPEGDDVLLVERVVGEWVAEEAVAE